MNIIALQPVDWTNAVFVQLLFALALGLPISIWSSFIAIRLADFRTARDTAIEALLHPVPDKWTDLSFRTYLMGRNGRLLNAKMTLLGHGQHAAEQRINEVFEELEASIQQMIVTNNQASLDDAHTRFAFAIGVGTAKLVVLRPDWIAPFFGNRVHAKRLRDRVRNLSQYMQGEADHW